MTGTSGHDVPAVATPDPVTRLLAVLDIREVPPDPYDTASLATDHFQGDSLPQLTGRIFGGQVLAQSLLAAARTVPDGRLPHSMHGYFLRPGIADQGIDFAVERLRDGRSFSARRAHALQAGRPILSMAASFQDVQDGIEYALDMPAAPDPAELTSAAEALGEIDHPVAKFWTEQNAFDLHHVDEQIYVGPDRQGAGDQLVWVRARGPVPDDQVLHRALLAFCCDLVMLEPVLRRGGLAWTTPGLSIASLDHAMWWHRDVRVDEWLLFAQSTSSAQGGRGLGHARVYAEDGALVASMAQEGMVRVP